MEYSTQGFLPEAFVNYLALLGWSPGDDSEIFKKAELISRFDPKRINKTNAVFDVSKLDWMNKRYISSVPVEVLVPSVRAKLSSNGLWNCQYEAEKKEWFHKVLNLLRVRATSLDDITISGRAFFTDEFDYEDKAWKKYSSENDPAIRLTLKQALTELRDSYAGLDPFNEETTESILRAVGEKYKLKTGLFIGAVRVASTGVGRAPGIFDVLIVLGRDQTIQRLDRFLEALQ